MGSISILLADDHDIVRFGIRTFLAQEDDIEVIGEASDGEEFIRLYKKEKPDLCLLDISMPGKDGVETANCIRELDPEAKILILSTYTDKELLNQLLKIGVDGYLSKTTTREDLLSGIRSIMKGQQVFSKQISKLISQLYMNGNYSGITDREQEILRLVAEGKTSKEIAQKLFISPRTVDTHRSNVMQKLDLNNIPELVRYAIKNNLLS